MGIEMDEVMLDFWAEEADSSDAIPDDEDISAELEDAFVAVVEAECASTSDTPGKGVY